MKISDLRNALQRRAIQNDVLTLLTGTVLGRALQLISLPLITRLYTPEQFSILAIFIGIVTTSAILASLRLEFAIPLATDNSEALHILLLSAFAIMSTTLLITLLLVFLPFGSDSVIERYGMAEYVWLLPLGTFFVAFYSVFQAWATRAKRFRSISKTKIYQSFWGAIITIAFGLLGMKPLGLILGNIMNLGMGAIRLAHDGMKYEKYLMQGLNLPQAARTAVKYRRYPLFSVPEALVNVAGVQVPIILIAMYNAPQAGYLHLSLAVLSVPMTVIGQSVSQVFTSRVRERISGGGITNFTLNTVSKLSLFGFPTLAMLGLIAPLIAEPIFGKEWAETGVVIAILVPWIAMQFVSSPISPIMYAAGRQRAFLILAASGAFLRIGSIIATDIWFPGSFVVGLSAASTVYYLFCLIFFLRAGGCDLLQTTKASVFPTVISAMYWVYLGASGLVAI